MKCMTQVNVIVDGLSLPGSQHVAADEGQLEGGLSKGYLVSSG